MPEHTDAVEILEYAGRTCTCGVGPWDRQGVCEACGGTDHAVATLLAPRQLDFATDDMLTERLRRIEEDARYVRQHIERAP